MVTKESINKFLTSKNIAVVGASRNNKKFGYSAYNYLKAKGYNVFAVNPYTDNISGDKCYKSLDDIMEKVEGVLIVLPPAKSYEVVRHAFSLNIKNIWIQQGGESKEAIRYCSENRINVVHNQCILMFAEPSSFPHNFHRWVNKITRKVPS